MKLSIKLGNKSFCHNESQGKTISQNLVNVIDRQKESLL